MLYGVDHAIRPTKQRFQHRTLERWATR
jgi:hypothetical protein